MEKLVSIVIPAYNAAPFLETCLRSVLAQTYPHFEVIAIDDGSQDATLEILHRYAAQDARIHVITQKNAGVSAARNAGLAQINGEFLTLVDADDKLLPTALETMVSLMQEDTDFLVCSHYEVRLSKKPFHHQNAVIPRAEIEARFQEFDRAVWWPWGKMFRADIIRQHGIRYDESIHFGEDHIFNLNFAKHMTGNVVISDKIVYNYYYIRGGICSHYYPEFNQLQKYMLEQIADFFGGWETLPPAYKQHYCGAYLKGCVEYYAAWLPFQKAVQAIKETFALYAPLTDEAMLEAHFTPAQYRLIQQQEYALFTRDFIRQNPRQTLLRKYKRNGKRVLEFLQKCLLGRK